MILARLSGNFPAQLLLGLEAAWCALYFGTVIYLAVSCCVRPVRRPQACDRFTVQLRVCCVQRAYRAMVSTPELIQDFEIAKSRRSTRSTPVRQVAKYKLQTDQSDSLLKYTRSSRVGRIHRMRNRRHDNNNPEHKLVPRPSLTPSHNHHSIDFLPTSE